MPVVGNELLPWRCAHRLAPLTFLVRFFLVGSGLGTHPTEGETPKPSRKSKQRPASKLNPAQPLHPAPAQLSSAQPPPPPPSRSSGRSLTPQDRRAHGFVTRQGRPICQAPHGTLKGFLVSFYNGLTEVLGFLKFKQTTKKNPPPKCS